MPHVQARGVYDKPEPSDGRRVLVDRLWPQGLAKDAARIDEWLETIAPSDELRSWYDHDPAKFDQFRRRYGDELREPQRAEAFMHLRVLAASGTVTLLTASTDLEHSQAADLAERLRLLQAAAAAEDDSGGDPVCWLPRVCPRCGAMTATEPPTTCPRCHLEIAVDALRAQPFPGRCKIRPFGGNLVCRTSVLFPSPEHQPQAAQHSRECRHPGQPLGHPGGVRRRAQASVTAPVTVDVNVFTGAVAGGNDAFHSWPSPPPVGGNLAANVVGILNDAREFSLFVSEHILANVVRVLCGAPPDGYGWEEKRAEQYLQVIVEVTEASGGAVIEPREVIADCPGYEDNRILECAIASGSVLIVSDDTDLLSMSPWRGIPVLTSGALVKRTDIMRGGRRRA